MNLTEIKKLDLTDWLEQNGFKHIKGTLYENPLRKDEKPSFSVFMNNKNNCWSWKDQTTGESGNIVDLICKIQKCDVAGVVKSFNNNNFSFSKAEHTKVEKKESTKIEIIDISKVTQKGLYYYAYRRKIRANLVKKYLKEVHYKVNDKLYYSLGFKNDINGYELRNKYSKMNIKGKSITTIKGICSDRVSIFEGFFNFLSALENFGVEEMGGDVIILNSTALLDGLLESLDLNKYETIYTFLDNDISGNNATEKIYNQYREKVLNCQNYYKNFNDFNDFLINKV
ncbi:MAG: toprim domain-containing protein [Campylobacterota bacterium]|nr:toprim domain-containing protein [Campylobacterota bacterium]